MTPRTKHTIISLDGVRPENMHFGICVPVKKGVYYKTLRERLHELANEVLERLRQQADANPTDSQKRARYTATLEFVRAQRKRDGITTPDGY